MGTEGITLRKAGVCEAKNAKHRLGTIKQRKHATNYGSRRESTKALRGAEGNTAQTADSEAKYE